MNLLNLRRVLAVSLNTILANISQKKRNLHDIDSRARRSLLNGNRQKSPNFGTKRVLCCVKKTLT